MCDRANLTGTCVQSGRLDGINTWQVPAGNLEWGKEYWWRVRITDPEYGTSTTLETRSFVTGVPQPPLTSHLGIGATNGQEFAAFPGNYTATVVDAKVEAAGPPLSVVRTYNSLDPRADGMFGAGWSTRWDMKIVLRTIGDTATLLVTHPDGRQTRYASNGDGTFQPPPGVSATLAEVDTGGWKLMDKSSTTYHFDAQGRLTRVTDGRGRTQTLHLTADGRLARVTAGGRSLHFTWTGPHVTAVSTDPIDGQPLTWTYEYQGDNLTRVCAPVAAPNCSTYDYQQGSRYRTVVLDSEPAGYWRLGDAPEETYAQDESRNGQNAYVYTGVTLGQPGALQGSADTAASFNRSTVELPLGFLARMRDDLSIETWFKTTQPGVIMSAGESESWGYRDGATGPVLYVGSDGKLRGQLGYTQGPGGSWSYQPITTSHTVNDGQWHHVVLNVSGDTQQLYLDGQSVGQVTRQLIPEWRGYAFIGSGASGNWTEPGVPITYGAFPFRGQIDEFAIYDRPLTAAEVQLHHANRPAVAHKLSKITLPSGRVWAENTYESVSDRLLTHTDQHGGTWTIGKPGFSATTQRTSVRVTDPHNGVITTEHDPWRDYRKVSQKDQLGKVTKYAYDPFGTITHQSGTMRSLGYQGEYTDPDTGAVNMHARWYRPATGTFTSRDTVTLEPSPSVRANRYTYAGASPLTGTDPTGHATLNVIDYSPKPTYSTCDSACQSYGGTPPGLIVTLGFNYQVEMTKEIWDFLNPNALTELMQVSEEAAREWNILPNGYAAPKGFWKASKKQRDLFLEMYDPIWSDEEAEAFWVVVKGATSSGGRTASSGGSSARASGPADCAHVGYGGYSAKCKKAYVENCGKDPGSKKCDKYLTKLTKNRPEWAKDLSAKFFKALIFITYEMVTNLDSPEYKEIRRLRNSGSKMDDAKALGKLLGMFRNGGRWDHKPYLQKLLKLDTGKKRANGLPVLKNGGYICIYKDCKSQIHYDVFSNIHFGYIMASLRFNNVATRQAPRVYARLSGTSEDIGDQLSVSNGWHLYQVNSRYQGLTSAKNINAYDVWKGMTESLFIAMIDYRASQYR